MRPRSGPIRAPLDVALGAPARVAALRVLAALPEPLTQRELARRAGIQVRSAQLALDVLTGLGLVLRTVGGRDHHVRLNRQHYLAPVVIGLFAAEADGFRSLREALVASVPSRARRDVCSLALFGSVARGDDTLDSDLDLLLIVRDATDRDGIRELVAEAATRLSAPYAIRPRVMAFARREARVLYRGRRPPFVGMAADAIPLLGPPLRELLA